MKNKIAKMYLQYLPVYFFILILDLFSIYVFFALSDFLIELTENVFKFTNAITMNGNLLLKFLPLVLYLVSLPIDSFKQWLIQIFLITYPREILQTNILKNVMTANIQDTNLLNLNRKINGFVYAIASIRIPIVNILKLAVSLYAISKISSIAVVGLIFMVCIFFVGRKFLKYEKRGFNHINFATSRSINLLNEMADATTTIRVNNAENFFICRFKKATDYLGKSFTLTGFTGRFREVFFTLFPFILPLIFVFINLNSKNENQTGSLTGAYSVFLLLLPVVINLINTDFKIYKGINFFKDIKPFLFCKPFTMFSKQIKAIKLKNISLTLEDKNILKNINLEFKQNEKIGIIGKTGSGKSTLAKVLMLNIMPTEGQIQYNEESVLTGIGSGNSIGYAGADTFIFSGTLKENILLGLKKYDETFLNTAIEFFSFNFEKDALLHKNLSGGEKSRIGILRSLIRKPDFLIIDEALSSISAKMAEDITIFLMQYVKTLIIISHRFSDLKDMQRIIMIKNGAVAFDDLKENAMQNKLTQELFAEQKEYKYEVD